MKAEAIVKPPGTFDELRALRARVLARYWREVDPIESRKLMSSDARLLEATDAWLCWIIRIVDARGRDGGRK